MDGGAWKAAVHGVAKSRTRLRDFPFTFHFHALETEMATHSSVLAWRIPGTGEPGGLPSLGSHRVGYDWSDLAAAAAYFTFSLEAPIHLVEFRTSRAALSAVRPLQGNWWPCACGSHLGLPLQILPECFLTSRHWGHWWTALPLRTKAPSRALVILPEDVDLDQLRTSCPLVCSKMSKNDRATVWAFLQVKCILCLLYAEMRSLGECALAVVAFTGGRWWWYIGILGLSLVFTALLCGIPICKQPSHSPAVGVSLSVPCMSLLTLLALPGIPVCTLCQDRKSVWVPQAEPSSFPDLPLHQIEWAAPLCVTLILLPQFPEEPRCSLRKPSPVRRTQRRLGTGKLISNYLAHCHITCLCMCVLSRFSCVRLFSTVWTVPGSYVHGDSPGKNTGVGCCALLQRIFLT